MRRSPFQALVVAVQGVESRGMLVGRCVLTQSKQARSEGLQMQLCCEHPGPSILEEASWTQPGAAGALRRWGSGALGPCVVAWPLLPPAGDALLCGH